MKVYTENEFVELVNNRNDINFLAAAITPWHALGIDAAIYQLLQQGIKLKGYVMLVAHAVTGSAIGEANFHMNRYADIKIVTISADKEPKTISDKIKNKCNKYWYYMKHNPFEEAKQMFYWAVPLKPSYELIPKIALHKKEYNVQIIITDEGLGSYLNTPFKWLRFSFTEGNFKAGLCSAWNLLIRDRYYIYRLQKRGQLKYYQLLKGKRGNWIQNDEAVSAYRYILGMEKYEEDFSSYGNSVIINTDMFFESGIFRQGKDNEIYKTICDFLAQSKIHVILKPHPREQKLDRYSNIKCVIEKKNIVAQESILATLQTKPYCIIGTASTTLVTAKILFGIEAISINYLINPEELKNKHFFDEFNKTFSNILYMPKTMDALQQNIKVIINKC